ncbi:MAG: nucleoside phosphorylase [Anaerolineae bacterium]|nr:nucleoside phosphorylase [Anaerolineae bacterium]
MANDILPLLKTSASSIAPNALVMGDPARVKVAAGLLDEAQEVGNNREYLTYTGALHGVPITLASHGIGSGGAAVCFEELARAGVKTIIRTGTCGGLQAPVDDGDFVIATGALRNEGLTERLVPLMYPAVAHYEVVNALLQAAAAAAKVGVPGSTHTGLVMSSDVFYPSEIMPIDWKVWTKVHVAAVEMELSALLIISALHGIRAGGIFTADGNLTRENVAADFSDYSPHRQIVKDATARMLQIALDALVSLAK